MQVHTTGIVLAALTVASAASAQTTQAVEWKASDGGNGHWYQVIDRIGPIDFWVLNQQLQSNLAAHLATPQTAAEDDFIWNTFQPGWAIFGGYQDTSAQDFREPDRGWRWVTGEPFTINPVPWAAREPNNGTTIGIASENFMGYHGGHGWNDADNTSRIPASYQWTYIVEWEADCNSDGIIDYGQILRGDLADDNHNNIPDVCETSVTGVLPPSVPSQGGVTITINGRNFPDNPTVLVGGTPATDVVRVSATRLTATTPAGLPGMTSISVNGFTLPDAFYYRPECGSDLDQNGSVDAGDISIILLDFGPCYQTTLAAPAPEVPPLLDAQVLPDAPRHR